jgi:hypothetical protein
MKLYLRFGEQWRVLTVDDSLQVLSAADCAPPALSEAYRNNCGDLTETFRRLIPSLLADDRNRMIEEYRYEGCDVSVTPKGGLVVHKASVLSQRVDAFLADIGTPTFRCPAELKDIATEIVEAIAQAKATDPSCPDCQVNDIKRRYRRRVADILSNVAK